MVAVRETAVGLKDAGKPGAGRQGSEHDSLEKWTCECPGCLLVPLAVFQVA